jgi:membrane associated rhomboid family serine protease
MNTVLEEIKKHFQKGDILTRIILLNILVFVLITLVSQFDFFFKINTEPYLIKNLSVSTNLTELLTHPWTLVTYMFTHENLGHAFFNLIGIYFIGKLFLQYFDEKKLLKIYLLGGLSGAILFIISYNIFPRLIDETSASCVGASASFMAILFTVAAFTPNLRVNLILIGPVKLIYIALVFFILDIYNMKNDNTGGHIGHIGGALFGYLFVIYFKKGKDITLWLNPIITKISNVFKPKSKIKVVYRRPKSDVEFNADKINHQKFVDKILDKIAKSGYDSLSKEEKEFLFKQSEK